MDDHGSNWSPSTPSTDTPRAILTGIMAAVLWAVIGLGVAWLSAQAGAPTASGWLALLSGPVALVIVGRRFNVRGISHWIRAGVVAVLAVVGIGSVAIFILTLVTYGRGLSALQTATPEGSPPANAATSSSDPIATFSPDPTPTPLAMDPADVRHIVAAIDELATADADEIIGWFNREGEWVTENVNVAFVENRAVSAYTDRIIAALQKVGEGRLDLTDDVTAILALRDDVAALAPGAEPAPIPTT